jgi:hypothetical protein
MVAFAGRVERSFSSASIVWALSSSHVCESRKNPYSAPSFFFPLKRQHPVLSKLNMQFGTKREQFVPRDFRAVLASVGMNDFLLDQKRCNF